MNYVSTRTLTRLATVGLVATTLTMGCAEADPNPAQQRTAGVEGEMADGYIGRDHDVRMERIELVIGNSDGPVGFINNSIGADVRCGRQNMLVRGFDIDQATNTFLIDVGGAVPSAGETIDYCPQSEPENSMPDPDPRSYIWQQEYTTTTGVPARVTEFIPEEEWAEGTTDNIRIETTAPFEITFPAVQPQRGENGELVYYSINFVDARFDGILGLDADGNADMISGELTGGLLQEEARQIRIAIAGGAEIIVADALNRFELDYPADASTKTGWFLTVLVHGDDSDLDPSEPGLN